MNPNATPIYYWEQNYDDMFPGGFPDSWQVIDLIDFKECECKNDDGWTAKRYPTFKWRRYAVIQYGNKIGYISSEKVAQYPDAYVEKLRE